MYAIAFDIKLEDIKTHHGDPYNQAYFELQNTMADLGFEWAQGSVYISKSNENNLTSVYKAITALSKID